MKPENDTPAAPPPNLPPAPRADRRLSPWLLVAVAALLLAGWQWLDTRARLAATQQEVDRRLAEAERGTQQEQGVLRQLRAEVDALQAKLGASDQKLAEFQEQGEALRTLHQDLARSREEATLLEIEQAITLAGQQLQLAGNVQAAVLALQAADASLARLDRPQLQPLRKALTRDLAKLAALPQADIAGISLRLEQALLGIDPLPLAAAARPPAPAEATAPAADLPWWQSAGRDLWQEIRSLIRIQRFDGAAPELFAPGQEFFLRENLKLRLLNARLALFARDQRTFRNELKVAEAWLNRHFDGGDNAVRALQATLHQLAASDIALEVPTLNDSQTALAGLRKEKR